MKMKSGLNSLETCTTACVPMCNACMQALLYYRNLPPHAPRLSLDHPHCHSSYQRHLRASVLATACLRPCLLQKELPYPQACIMSNSRTGSAHSNSRSSNHKRGISISHSCSSSNRALCCRNIHLMSHQAWGQGLALC